jgi:hypothetical protein
MCAAEGILLLEARKAGPFSNRYLLKRNPEIKILYAYALKDVKLQSDSPMREDIEA